MGKGLKNKADTEGFAKIAWAKFNKLSVEEKVSMLRADGIPADANTVDHFFAQLVEIAIKAELNLEEAEWPWGRLPKILRKT